MENQDIVKAALEIESQAQSIKSQKFFIGFDGVIDEIIHVVKSRESESEFTRYETINELAEKIASAAGKSANLELFPTQEKIGGNGPLMSLAVSHMGPSVSSVGLMGYPTIDPVFNKMQEKCELYSLGKPGHTDALEFADGKLMLGKLALLNEVNWKRICDVMGEDKFMKLVQDNDCIAVTNWTMLLELPEIIDKIIAGIPEKSPQTFFFDLADPEKRLDSEIADVLKQIQTLDKKAKSILGVNLSEAEQISAVLGISNPVSDGVEGLKKGAHALKEALGIHGLVIHSVSYAGAAVGAENESIAGPYCNKPKITTGAGDHFNGGFCSALLGGTSLKGALYAGVGVSGWYVRNGGPSPELSHVVELLNDWATGKLDQPATKEKASV